MRKGWKTIRLDDACNVEYGTRVVRKKDGGSIYPVYGGGGATFKMDIFNREDRLVVARFAMSEICTRFVKGKFFLNDSGLTVSPKDELLSMPFLNWLLIYNNDTIYSFGKGSAQKNLDMDDFRDMVLSYPISLSEQQRIVDILDKEFAKIEELKSNAELNLRHAKDLFKVSADSYFSNNNCPISTFGDICIFVRGPFGGSLKKSCFVEKGFPIYEQQNAIYNRFSFRYFIDEMKYNEMKRFTVSPGDLIMSCSGTIGKVAIVPDNAPVGIINQALLKLTPKKNVSSEYLKWYMNSLSFEQQIKSHSQGAAIQNVASVSVLKTLSVPLPSLPEQQIIVSTLDELNAKCKVLQDNYTKTIALCDDLKQSLLRKAFNGEL